MEERRLLLAVALYCFPALWGIPYGSSHSLPARCQGSDNPEFSLGCVNTPITQIKIQRPTREAAFRVSRGPVPLQSEPDMMQKEIMWKDRAEERNKLTFNGERNKYQVY